MYDDLLLWEREQYHPQQKICFHSNTILNVKHVQKYLGEALEINKLIIVTSLKYSSP